MKAVLCRELGSEDLLTVDDLEEPECGDHQVLIQVCAAGVNFPDVLMIRGLYQFKPDLPFTPGSEVAGDVIAVGAAVKNIHVGQRVCALTGLGAFAEKVAVDTSILMVSPIPPNMDYITASAFTMTYNTAYFGLKQRGQLCSGETLLVLGAAGGIGSAAVELGKAMGATVIAAASSDKKLALAKELGADHLINYSETNLKHAVKDITHGNGANVVYDPVGGDLFHQALAGLAWRGRYLVMGYASGEIPTLAVNRLLLKCASAVGVAWGEFSVREPGVNAENFKELLLLYERGKIKPRVSQVFPLEKTAEALGILSKRKAMGKVVVQVS